MSDLNFAASCVLSFIEEKTREDGSVFKAFKPDAPEWCRSLVMVAHDGEFPSNSRYDLICKALDCIADSDAKEESDALEEVRQWSLDALPCWTGDLLSFFADHPGRLKYCDQAAEDGSAESIYDTLSEGWRLCFEEVLYTVISSLEEEKDSIFNPDTDCEIILSDSNGIYIPKIYCDDIDEEEAELMCISWEDVKTCQSGPDCEGYWDAWQTIEQNAEWKDFNGEEWRLLHNGDLWAVKANVEIPESWLF